MIPYKSNVREMEFASEKELMTWAGKWVQNLPFPCFILLTGALGSGKTSFVRGCLQGRGWRGQVRSPTFNLVNLYPTDLPAAHADLYRLIGQNTCDIEELLEDRLSFIEWPGELKDRLLNSQKTTGTPRAIYDLTFDFLASGRKLTLVESVINEI